MVQLGCKDGSTTSSHTNNVDPRLIGEWYYVDTAAVTVPSPNMYFYGIQINNDKTIWSLGIEFASGKIAHTQNIYAQQIVSAENNILIVTYNAPPLGHRTDTLQYRFDHDKLIITNGTIIYNIYQRTQLGTVLTTPIESMYSVHIDSNEVQSVPVGNSIPAYASKRSNSEIQLYAIIPSGSITITIDNFNGIGTYPIGVHNGKYTIFGGDYILTMETDSLSNGTITFDTYDEATSRCSGRFDFTVRFYIGNNQYNTRQLRNGIFSVPVYR